TCAATPVDYRIVVPSPRLVLHPSATLASQVTANSIPHGGSVLLMNYFIAGKLYSSGIVEGLNLRINLCMRKAFGYRSFDLLQTSLFHTLGDLPEPEFTHRFC
ncbi:MAG: transposase, partial [Verrucomicrobia bacterium]|nr:transposase [Verrucomicrobiota bacterium]